MVVHLVGLDIVGPFPKAAGNKRYLLVGIDYFTKWVEAKPLANIRDDSSGETLLHDLGSLEPLFQTMDSNLTAKPSEDTVANWGSQIGT